MSEHKKQATRPDLNKLIPGNPLPAMFRSVGLVQRLLQPEFHKLGISWTQWGVLRTLDKAEEDGETLRLSELSERLLIQPPSVTSVVDRLERQGLITRVPSPEDKRARELALTDKAREIVAQVMRDHPPQILEILSCLDESERSELRHLLERLNDHIIKKLK